MTIDDRLDDIFREVFADDAITVNDATSPEDIDAWDSLAHINLMFSLEDEFSVKFRDEEFASVKNVGEIKRLLQEHVS
jgi:acyl carrier protein